MRNIFLISILMLAGCASSPEPNRQSSNETLDIQTLKAGECGIFGWTTDEKRSFVFYADEKTAKYAPNGAAIELTANEPFPSLTYTDPQGGPVTLKLGEGEPIVGGTRYTTAHIATKTQEGWDRIMPVAIVRSCQAP